MVLLVCGEANNGHDIFCGLLQDLEGHQVKFCEIDAEAIEKIASGEIDQVLFLPEYPKNRGRKKKNAAGPGPVIFERQKGGNDANGKLS